MLGAYGVGAYGEPVVFHRWLYWKDAAGQWKPSAPPDSEQGDNLVHLGDVNGVAIYTTSRACFDDFVLLVSSSAPASQKAANSVLGKTPPG